MSLALPALVRAHNGEDHGAPTPMASMSGSDAMSGSDSMSDMPGMTSGTPMPGMSGDSMSGMSSGDSMTGDSMSGMNMSDYIDILPLWVSVIWIVALAGLLWPDEGGKAKPGAPAGDVAAGEKVFRED